MRNICDERNRTCNFIEWQLPNRQLLHQGLTGIKHKYQSLLDHKPIDLTLAKESRGKQAYCFIKLTNMEWYYIMQNNMDIGKRKVADELGKGAKATIHYYQNKKMKVSLFRTVDCVKLLRSLSHKIPVAV